MNTQKLIDRLMSRTEAQPNGCIYWIGYTNKYGYGQIGIGQRTVLTHRLSHELFIGHIPHGLCVCHKCDVPKCVNPDHLFLGTHKDNAIDKINKGRGGHLYGEQQPQAKLTESSVSEIRQIYAAGGVSQRKIAKLFGVSQVQVWRVIARRHWSRLIQ